MINFEKELNSEQLAAATQINGPLLILAGAGTGKTKTMTFRAGYMIENGINPENILMLTFTNKAAKEMKDRLAGLLNADDVKKLTACTFHSFCALMLRYYGERIGVSKHFTILSTGDDEDIISIVKADNDKTRYSGKGFPPNGKVCGFISMSINKGISIDEVMCDTKYADFSQEVEELAKLSLEYRKNHNLLNYDDILVRFIDLITECPDVAKKIGRAYCYIMVDEYQDTNPLQDRILLTLFNYTKNIAVVGDDMQSLYGFRGAEVENIIDFPNKFEGCKIIKLVKNYRSSQEILDLSNQIVKHATEGYPKDLVGLYSSSIKPKILSPQNQYEESDKVIEIIYELHRDGVPYDEICVVERNSILSAGLEVKLNKEGINFDKYGGSKYTDLSYVKDILAYLKIMTNPHDEISWFRVLQVHRGIGNMYARRISEECRVNGFEALINKKYAKRKYGPELSRLHQYLVSCDGKKLKDLISGFIDFYCDTKKKNIEEMDTDEGSRTQYLIENSAIKDELQKLVEIADHYRSVDSFLDDLLLDNTKANDHEQTGNLVISTIHSVKGLEYQAVICLDCIDDIFPNALPETKEDNEELRCFYVAVTRAKKYLYIMCPESAMRFGLSIDGMPSRYLNDSQDLVDTDDDFYNRYNDTVSGYEPFDDGWN